MGDDLDLTSELDAAEDIVMGRAVIEWGVLEERRERWYGSGAKAERRARSVARDDAKPGTPGTLICRTVIYGPAAEVPAIPEGMPAASEPRLDTGPGAGGDPWWCDCGEREGPHVHMPNGFGGQGGSIALTALVDLETGLEIPGSRRGSSWPPQRTWMSPSGRREAS